MRIATLLHGLNSIDGGFHYELVFLDALAELAPRFAEEIVCIASPNTSLTPLASLGGLAYRDLPIRTLHGVVPQQWQPEAYLQNKPVEQPRVDPNTLRPDRELADAFRKAGVDLILLLGPHLHVFSWLTPFIMSIHDLNHRLQPEFPEVSAFGEFHRREYLYSHVCRYATFVLVNSEVGKEDVLQCYGNFIDESRIRVLPYYPPVKHKPLPSEQDLTRVATKYRLPSCYFFYPAQFWRHKNHVLILRAMRTIVDKAKLRVPVVFCGSYADYHRAATFMEVRSLAAQLGLAGDVHYLGPVPEEDMAALYTLSVGLVMPTFFGPTNIPPLEAWHFNRPVITSDIRGLREQSGDASILIDPRSPEDLAQAMLQLWQDKAFCAEFGERGRKRLASYTWDAFVNGIAAILTEACERVRAGCTPKFPGSALL